MAIHTGFTMGFSFKPTEDACVGMCLADNVWRKYTVGVGGDGECQTKEVEKEKKVLSLVIVHAAGNLS